jgi:DNA repair protein RecN (Recombination protein N)
LDRFAGESVASVLEPYARSYAERRAAATELERLRAEAQSRAREIDVLRFGLTEIEQVDPEAGEDITLAAEAARLHSADDLRVAAGTALTYVAGGEDEPGGALSEVTAARKALEQGPSDAALAELGRRLAEAGYQLADLASELARYLSDLDAEPGRLGTDRRATLPTGRPDPKVRVEHRRGPDLGPPTPRPDCSTWRPATTGSSSWPPGRRAG